MAVRLNNCGLSLDAIFNNADTGFDAGGFRTALAEHCIIENVLINLHIKKTPRQMWIVIKYVVIMAFALAMVPIQKFIYKKIRNKYFAWLITSAAGAAIAIGLVELADLLGIRWK
jgi:hypothetical protein